MPLALRLRASCPSQRSVPPPCRPGVAKQVRLGRRRSPGGSLRVAWVVRVSSQAAHNVTRSPPDHTPIHASAGKRSSAKRTRSPSTLAAYSQTHPHTGPFRGSAIVPTQSPSFFPSSEEVPTLPYIRTRRQPYSPECGEVGFCELGVCTEFSEVRMQDPALPRSYRARITTLEPRYRLFLPRLRRYNRRARVKRSSACRECEAGSLRHSRLQLGDLQHVLP